MCRVYNTIGSLNDIQYHLVKNNLDEFNTLDEIINFQKDFDFLEHQIISKHTRLIQDEKNSLEKDINNLNQAISAKKYELEEQLGEEINKFNNQIQKLPISNFRNVLTTKGHLIYMIIQMKILVNKFIFHFRIFYSIKQIRKLQSEKIKLYNNIVTDFDEAVNQSSSLQLNALNRKIRIVNEITNSIYGALGEHKVVNTLKSLSDDYILINDFTCSFDPPIHYSKEDEYIKSVQIDHILVSPSSIFLIETKNWSQHSIDTKNLCSPVQQVNRANFALFKLISEEISKSKWNFKRHEWGNRKIPIKNIIVFINNKPKEEFQFVKILRLSELLRYIQYFTPCLTINEAEKISEFLLSIMNRKETSSILTI